MTIHYSKTDQFIVVMGRTFQHRAAFQRLGAKFNFREKTWYLPHSPENLHQIDALCRAAGGGPVDEFEPKFEASRSTVIASELEKDDTLAPQNVYTIAQLSGRIATVIQNAFQTPVWVSGELQNINFRGKAVYLNLCEPKSHQESGTITINAAIWQDVWLMMQKKYGEQVLKDILQEGMKLKFLCRVSFYKDRSSITLGIVDIDPEFTKGALALARQKLLQELRRDGLDKLNKSLAAPLYPFRIGLISARGSRAYSDFIDQLHSHSFPGEVVFYHASMQGAQTPDSVCQAMEELRKAQVDLIVITRGGGSSADLRWFDDRKICMTACQLGVPLIAAIGHHEDTSVLETICFQQEKTPTAAAEYILKLFERAKLKISDLEINIERLSRRALRMAEDQLSRHREQFLYVTRMRLNQLQQSVVNLANRLHVNALQSTHQKLQLISAFEMKLVARDPRQWLAKGWVQLQSQGKILNSIHQLSINQEVQASLLDGIAKLVVQETQKRTTHESTKH